MIAHTNRPVLDGFRRSVHALRVDLVRAVLRGGTVDCEGYWTPCTHACEIGHLRTWTETVARSGVGAYCPARADCEPGEGACPNYTMLEKYAMGAAAQCTTQGYVDLADIDECEVAVSVLIPELQSYTTSGGIVTDGNWYAPGCTYYRATTSFYFNTDMTGGTDGGQESSGMYKVTICKPPCLAENGCPPFGLLIGGCHTRQSGVQPRKLSCFKKCGFLAHLRHTCDCATS